jgi:integrase/recombinase XerD
MFEKLFEKPGTIKRLRNASLLEDRLRYLTYRAERGSGWLALREIARYQYIATKYLNIDNDRIITIKEIKDATRRWLRDEMLKFGRKDFSCSSRGYRFISDIKIWLKFLDRLEDPKQRIPWQLKEYVNYMRKEKGLSEATIYTRRFILVQFFSKTKEDLEHFLANLIPAHIDTILIKELSRGLYARRTIKNQMSILRSFLRYAEHRNWCPCGIVDSINSPRVYRHDALPTGLSLEEIQRLVKTTEGERPLDIRDRAIILFLAVYGFRASEVRQLRLEDIDWKQRTFCLKHSKRGPAQQFPLSQTVADALLEYITKTRPQCVSYGEIFLTFRAPFRPLKGLASLIYARWRRLGVDIKKHGTHSLRHACASRLINQGVPLKTIADQLGHRDLETTRVYTKVNLTKLREVANFNLGGVL